MRHFDQPFNFVFGEYSPLLTHEITRSVTENTYFDPSADMRHSGFTLYEMLLTLTLIAILVGLGLPSFADIAANSRLRTEVNALFHAIHVARKESRQGSEGVV